jgi:hypothetical protein
VRGVLKGCAIPGFDVAEGAPEAARGVAVVAVSAVMGVEVREGVVVKARVRVRVSVRRERQRVQIMVVVVFCVCKVWRWRGVVLRCQWLSFVCCMPLELEVRKARSRSPKAAWAFGGDARRCRAV